MKKPKKEITTEEFTAAALIQILRNQRTAIEHVLADSILLTEETERHLKRRLDETSRILSPMELDK